jgi:hypothetical protein
LRYNIHLSHSFISHLSNAVQFSLSLSLFLGPNYHPHQDYYAQFETRVPCTLLSKFLCFTSGTQPHDEWRCSLQFRFKAEQAESTRLPGAHVQTSACPNRKERYVANTFIFRSSAL